MTDISVGQSFDPEKLGQGKISKGEFAKAKKTYLMLMKKLKKSDLANSPSAIESELKVLSKMLEAAQKEGLEDEAAKIEERIKILNSSVKSEERPVVGYYMPISLKKGNDTPAVAEDKYLPIVSSFGDASDEHKSYLINKLTKGNTVPISDSTAEAMIKLGEMGAHPNIALYFFEKFAKNQEDISAPKVIDVSLTDKFKNLRAKGIDDTDAIKVLTLFNEKYKDKEILDASINKLVDAGVSPEKVIEIISELTVENDETRELSLSFNAVSSTASVKRILAKTNKVEVDEQENPINRLNIIELKNDNEIIVMKNKQVVAIYPITKESKKEYEKFVSKQQDGVILDFAKNFKDKDGEISLEPQRIITSLRRNGVTMDYLNDLTKFCYTNNSINTKNLNAVNQIKSAGALSSDVLTILSAVNKDAEGNYDAEDMKNAEELTSSVMEGQNVVSLLPLVKGSEDSLDVALYLSSCLGDKNNIADLIKMTKDANGNTVDTSLEIMKNLTRNFLDKDNPMSSIDFVLNAKSIINAAKNPRTDVTNDDSAGICAIMCNNNETPENILRGLHACKNQDGEIDTNLADILWQMSLEYSSINDIERLLDKCKSDTGVVNQSLAKSILQFYEAGHKTKEIMDMVLNTG